MYASRNRTAARRETAARGIRTRALLCAGAMAAAGLLAAPASAQTARGFALDRFSPSGGGSDWFALESLDFSGHYRVAGGVTVNWADQPLSVHDTAGNEFGRAIVESQLFLHTGLS